MLAEELRQMISAHQKHGRRMYSIWDADTFLSTVERAATKLCARLPPDDSSSRRLLGAYIRLVEEAFGLGRLAPASGPSGRIETLLWHCLILLAPHSLPDLPELIRMQTLVDTWNLCEARLSCQAGRTSTSRRKRVTTLLIFER